MDRKDLRLKWSQSDGYFTRWYYRVPSFVLRSFDCYRRSGASICRVRKIFTGRRCSLLFTDDFTFTAARIGHRGPLDLYRVHKIFKNTFRDVVMERYISVSRQDVIAAKILNSLVPLFFEDTKRCMIYVRS